MFGNWKIDFKVERVKRERAADPIYENTFGDPVASLTEWHSLTGDATNFRTKKLSQKGADRVAVKPLLTTYLLFFGVFFTFPSLMLWVGYSQFKGFPLQILLPAIIGTGAVFMAFREHLTSSTFDKRRGLFWKGAKHPEGAALRHATRLDDIHALQLIRKYVSRRYNPSRGSGGDFFSYELNLVLKEGRRINVMTHGNEKRMRKDASMLAAFLGKPLWDGTGRIG